MIAGAYVSSYLCGLGMENVIYEGLMGTVARYFYYQVRKLMTKPSLLDAYDLSVFQRTIPTRKIKMQRARSLCLMATWNTPLRTTDRSLLRTRTV